MSVTEVAAEPFSGEPHDPVSIDLGDTWRIVLVYDPRSHETDATVQMLEDIDAPGYPRWVDCEDRTSLQEALAYLAEKAWNAGVRS